MEYRKSRQILKQVMRGVLVNPHDRKEAICFVTHHRQLVPCPRCKVNRILRYQKDRGYYCLRCSINK